MNFKSLVANNGVLLIHLVCGICVTIVNYTHIPFLMVSTRSLSLKRDLLRVESETQFRLIQIIIWLYSIMSFQIFKDVSNGICSQPYLVHKPGGTISNLDFVPYEDVLGVGHGGGFASILIPGLLFQTLIANIP